MKVFSNLEELMAYGSVELGTSPWFLVKQSMIDQFAKATLDEQWIHTDPKKAVIHSPFKNTIAHGFLTLSLAPMLMRQLYKVESVQMGVNYGANKIRFTAPVLVDSEIRIRANLISVDAIKGGVKMTTGCTFEIKGQDKPACVAELITLLYE